MESATTPAMPRTSALATQASSAAATVTKLWSLGVPRRGVVTCAPVSAASFFSVAPPLPMT